MLGLNDLNRTPVTLVLAGTVVVALPKSICSQEYVNWSAESASVALPTNINGVPFGMV